MNNKGWVYEHHEDNAIEFLEILSPIYGLLSDNRSIVGQNYIYRGLASTEYQLLPTAFRAKGKIFQGNRWYNTPLSTNGHQIRAEIDTLLAFLRAVDRQGHYIPEDSYFLRKRLEGQSKFTGSAFGDKALRIWPDPQVLSLMALAQHYGVPTRLLDWSLDPYVSAYFAAISAVKNGGSRGRLCVWALLSDILWVQEYHADYDETKKMPITLVHTPTATNPNLKAQKGVFLSYTQYDIPLRDNFDPVEYDQIITNHSLTMQDGDLTFLVKFTLPVSEAPQLLLLLAKLGISAGSIFPDLSGAANSIMDTQFWPRTDHNRKIPYNERVYSKIQKMEEFINQLSQKRRSSE